MHTCRIIADSGSTKTEWAIQSDDGKWTRLSTQGLNPRVTSDAQFRKVLEEIKNGVSTYFMPHQGPVCRQTASDQLSIHFYGAGCGTDVMQRRVEALLSEFFPDAVIEVAGDLLGACHAVSNGKSGVVGILGTGSNACLFDGEHIIRQVTSTGYILGDEGSGNHIGRRLLKDFLTDRMPAEIAKAMNTTKEEAMSRIYGGEYPNRYMASFAPVALNYRQTAYVKNLLQEVFESFWREMMSPIADGGDVRLVGSVADAFADEIKASAPKGFSVVSITKSPIESLISNP